MTFIEKPPGGEVLQRVFARFCVCGFWSDHFFEVRKNGNTMITGGQDLTNITDEGENMVYAGGVSW
jgi:hypothetical protein